MDILILAAGKGSRFLAGEKIFANFWGIKVIDLIVKQALKISSKVSVVSNKKLIDQIDCDNKFLQEECSYGTGWAVQSYLKINNSDNLLVLPGDVPLIEEADLRAIEKIDADVVVGIMKSSEFSNEYGRVIFDEEGNLSKIAEFKDHKEKTDFVNTAIIKLSKNALKLIPSLKKNVHNEIFLTDIVEIAKNNNLNIKHVELSNERAVGFNSLEEFHNLLKIAQNLWKKKASKSGAIFFDINSVYFSYNNNFEAGAIIEPNCFFGPNVFISKNANVRSFSYLQDCSVNGEIGPFANIKHSQIGKSIIGSFVEVKNSKIENDAKIKHLAYIGNAEIKNQVNIGAGVVFCNFDGKQKHKSLVNEKAFIGANSSLIAPIEIGSSAFLAAGGVYNKNVEANDFAIARTKQLNSKKKDKE